MNFAHDSLKLRSKPQNEDFCFDVETPQGHFFAVLDFAPHDYANLNATLKGKLETVVGSFSSLSKFSADLFLGFLAKEINNFLHHLGEQSSGPEILCSAALCLVGGNRLSYLICGNVRIDITGGRLLSLSGEPQALDAPGDDVQIPGDVDNKKLDQLGVDKLEAPLTDRVQTFTLLDDDVVLIMTPGLEAGFDRRQLPRELVGVGSPEPKSICEALMKASASSRDDRTVVVITGPYENDVDPELSDLSKAIALLEARVNALSESKGVGEAAARVSEREVSDSAKREQRVTQQLEALRGDVSGKAAATDILELEEKLKSISNVLGRKADSADVSILRQELFKPDRNADAFPSAAEISETHESRGRRKRSTPGWALLLILITALGAAFIGAWLQSRAFKKGPEVWAVRTSANQIVIRRLDGDGEENQRTVSLNVAEPLKLTGEQTFSSFADVTLYIDKLTNPAPASSPALANLTNQPGENQSAEAVTEIVVKPGDSLKKFAERYQVAEAKIRELNPTITRWTTIQSGQRINVPTATPAATAASPTPSPAAIQPTAQLTPGSSAATIEVVVGPGDSINRFAQRYNATPAQLRELNPQITNWAKIRTGQKVVVPIP
ncbi:MAG: LysM peptidoglycan-binding domain-containing protein [Pyrinomonadaceae bacterium]|nr:LysM peptidoglycan-binding domain-containing protein [Pyrinomonadaceae bacterium]